MTVKNSDMYNNDNHSSITTFKKPKRRLRQRPADSEVSDSENQENKCMEDLNSKKKRRLERKEQNSHLNKLFEIINQDRKIMEEKGMYSADYDMKKIRAEEVEAEKRKYDVNLIIFDDDYMLDSDVSDIEAEVEEIKKAASLYLDEDTQENIDTAIQEAKNEEVVESTDHWNQEFFRPGPKSIRQPGLVSLEIDTKNSEKEIHISELSATSKGRNFLLNSGCMKDWHRGGWICPNYIYQWLFEVVALEPNKTAAKNALSTLFVLWSLPGARVETKLPHIYKQRYISLETFKSVLLACDAVPSQLIESVLSSPEEQDIVIHTPNKESYDPSTSRYIPLSQLGWMIKAFGFSIRLWSRAYTSYEIRYIVRLLLQLSLDKTGFLVIQEIQTAIDNCLSAMSDKNWETEIRMIANDVCDIVPSTKRQVHILDCVKTNYERSRYLRRLIGVVCLERCLEKEVPGSVDHISTDQSIIKQMHQIFMNPMGFFINRRAIDFDYEEVFIRVAMLDAAIGISDDEIRKDKLAIFDICEELHQIGLGIGAKLGVMKKTLAHEMIQRVWSRVTNIVGPRAKYAA